MLGLPMAIWYLIFLLFFVAVLFVGFKRPIYEVMALAFVFIVVITGRFDLFWPSLLYPSTSSLFYAIFAFLVVAVIFDETKVVERIINLIMSVVGRFRGGAGYVALLASTFMASLSGSGPGNVATTGVFTIPTMKRTGYSPALAATTEMSSSMLGNIIPPSGIVLLTYGILDELHPGSISSSAWMMAAYGVGLWFFLQRWLTLWVFCRYYKVEPVPARERPRLGASLRTGWSALLLPLSIFLPLLLDAQMKDWLTARLGEAGAEAYSTSVLMFTPGLAAAYALGIGRRAVGGFDWRKIHAMFRKTIDKVVPIGVTIYMAYAISQVFVGLEATNAIEKWFVSLGLPVWALILVLPLFFMVLGMVLPGSSQIAILGGAVIAAFGTLGGDPVLFAALLPAMTGALEGMTPPLALGMYVAMGIAGSGFKETAKLTIVWVACHVLLSMVLLTGWLPIYGL